MKRILSLTLLAAMIGLSAGKTSAQTYGNEWIETGRTYYKFKVAQKGLFRIQKSTLDAAGIPGSTPGSAFKMYRDGQQVPLWVSSGSAALGASDYVEFFGRPADGKDETAMYLSPADQPNDRASLHNDTAVYFLTYDAAGSGFLRFAEVANNIPSNPGTPADWCWSTSTVSYKNTWLPGRNLVGGCGINEDYTMYSPQYETGEGYVNAAMGPNASHTVNFSTPGSVAGVVSLLSAGVIGSSYSGNGNDHYLQLELNNVLVWDTTYGKDETKRISVEANVGQLPAVSTLKFSASQVGSCYYDRWGVAFAEIQYARDFDAGNAGSFAFRLSPAVGASPYLEFTNVAHNGSARLYDLTTRTVMTGVISGSTVRFQLPASMQDREMVLVGGGASFIQNVSVARTMQFTNWASTAQQGDLIIVTHPLLREPVSGQDQIAAYEAYRESAAGGNHRVVVASVEDLYDQFGYGARMNPIAIKRFFHYAYDTWSPKPQSAFMIGHGLLYHQIKAYEQAGSAYNFPIVPTYGDPGADIPFVNWGTGGQQMMGIGRLSVRDAASIKSYREKVMAYEALQVPAQMPTIQTEGWKKSALHIAGASNYDLQQLILLPNLRSGESIIRDTMVGYTVRTVAKNNTNPVDPVTSPFVDSLMNGGMQLLNFHGHAGPSGFDYNINTPENYTNGAKSPVFLGLGCDIAQISNLQASKTISERYVEHGGGGAIAMWAMNSISFTDWHYVYLGEIYRTIGSAAYGKNIGEQQRVANNSLINRYGWSQNHPLYPTYRKLYAHNENFLLQGDPTLHLYSPDRPDYHVATTGLSTLPTSVSTALDSFRIRVASFNLGKASRDTAITVKVEHTNPQNVTTTVKTYNINVLRYSDTSTVWIPLDKSRDLGLNRYRVTIDAGDKYPELSEVNNSATVDIFIFSDDLVPVYPYKYSIVNTPQVTLKASSLNPFRASGRYRIEMDTTELFNSPAKQSTTINAPGGLIKWTPSVLLRDSTVYYWRTAFDSTVANQYNWSTSSFVYMGGASTGWNQSHYYQLATAARARMDYAEGNRRFDFQRYLQRLKVQSKLMRDEPDLQLNRILLNDVELQISHCPNSHPGCIQVMVVDSLTGIIWENTGSVPGSNLPDCGGAQHGRAIYVHEFSLTNQASRNYARKFLDSIPAGNYVIVKNSILYDLPGYPNPFYIPSPASLWRQDSAAFNGASLYHSLKNMGFTQIDSYRKAQPFYFIAQKGVPSYQVQQAVGADSMTALTVEISLPGKMASGKLESVDVGPAAEWKTLQWRSRTTDALPQNDSVGVAVYGMRAAGGVRQLLYRGQARDTSLAWISADTFPRLQLEWTSADTINRSSPQFDFWRVLYKPLPEAALAPSLLLTIADSLQVGQNQEVAVAIENISNQPMDSMLVSYKVIGADGAAQTLARQHYKPLPPGDTLHARLAFDPAAFVGKNLLLIEANPDEDQPEQYHPNNLGYLPFRVSKDDRNPLVDVTFDGIHILDRDIVSSKPFIKVQLKDENRFLALDDTALLKMYIRYPNDDLNARHPVPFDGTTCKFIPAKRKDDGTLENEAYIEYRPAFTEKADQGKNIFELAVQARDKTGNSAGPDYRVAFEVVYESSITRLLNYPNPFSTSTAFLFTLTGSEIPAQFKIQIMTVSGKVVREITKAELGPLHVGRNITDYKWDGRDQYGQMLGNGVYLYRVVTVLSNGDELEHRESGADKFFQNGWGKMYIMR